MSETYDLNMGLPVSGTQNTYSCSKVEILCQIDKIMYAKGEGDLCLH